jgi:rubrerythrin
LATELPSAGAPRLEATPMPVASLAALDVDALTHAQKEILLYSFYRDGELRGSNLLFRLLRKVDDPEAQMMLTEHLSDETRHAWLWTQRIRELGSYPVAILDGYQTRLGQRAGLPRKVVDLFALTIVVEQSALKRYMEHLKRPDTPERTREVLEAVTKDEGWHIDWVRRKGREYAEREGDPAWMERSIERFRAIDREVKAELQALEDRAFGLTD